MELTKDYLFNSRYRLLEEKGRGSFGEVWLARDEETDMDVAIKVYIALDSKGIDEFKEEYKSVYNLNHPNLLHAYHFDIIEKRPYLIMPYCPKSSEDMIGKTDEMEIWKFIRDVASGLAYLHAQNIVHRDIKPDNILKNPDGIYLITDFGISTRMKSTLRKNSTKLMPEHEIAGTVGYMAPELFSSAPAAVKSTDIWAFGASVYEIMTGELPFFGQGGIMLLKGAEIPVLMGNWSENLKGLVRACMEKNTWDRPSAEQIHEIAKKILSGDTKSMTTTLQHSTDDSKRHRMKRWHAVLIISAIVLIVALVGVLCFPSGEQKAAEAPDRSENTVSHKNAVEETVTERTDTRQKLDRKVPDANSELEKAIEDNDIAKLEQFAQSGNAKAYLPLSRLYLKNPNTHNLADRYARKALDAGYSEAQEVIGILRSYGYYD